MAQTRIRPDEQLTTGTQGDILLRNAGGEWQDLGIGASGEVLTSNGTTASWQASGGAGLCSTGTYAALEVIRAASGLTPGCHYKLTGYSNGNAALGTVDLILLAADVDKFAEDVAVLTTLDDEAWPGKFDWDNSSTYRLYEIYDSNRKNLWSGYYAAGISVPTFFIDSADFTNNKIIDSSVFRAAPFSGSDFSGNYMYRSAFNDSSSLASGTIVSNTFINSAITISSAGGWTGTFSQNLFTSATINITASTNIIEYKNNKIYGGTINLTCTTLSQFENNSISLNTGGTGIVITTTSGITMADNLIITETSMSATSLTSAVTFSNNKLINSSVSTLGLTFGVSNNSLTDSSVSVTGLAGTLLLSDSEIKHTTMSSTTTMSITNSKINGTSLLLAFTGNVTVSNCEINNPNVFLTTPTGPFTFTESRIFNSTLDITTSISLNDSNIENSSLFTNADTISDLALMGGFVLNTGGFNVTNVQIIDDGTQTLTANNTGTYRGFGVNTLV